MIWILRVLSTSAKAWVFRLDGVQGIESRVQEPSQKPNNIAFA